MLNGHLNKLLDFYKLAVRSSLDEQTVKDEMTTTKVAMDRAFVKGEDQADFKEYYAELEYLLYNVVNNEQP